MDVLLAAYHLVKDFVGGAAALAAMLPNKSGTTLSHEVNPNCPGYKLGLDDAVRISTLTRDPRILHAFASEMNCMVIPLAPPVAGQNAVSRTATLAREFGDLMAELSTTLADGQVTTNELRRTEREAGELVAALHHVLAEVRHLHEGTKP